nr:hypothetical protein [uncultured Desulfuromonas sp.]
MSDEEMIAHFRAHRAEFEELVRRYREYPRPPDQDTSFWYKKGDTQELMQRAGVSRLVGLAPSWFPNPYSAKSAKYFSELIKSGQAAKRGLFYKYDTVGVIPVPKRLPLPWKKDKTNQYRFNTLGHGTIWKDYCHIPEIARIEDGELLWPLGIVGKGARVPHYQEIDGIPVGQRRKRVFASLNEFPEHWRNFECVYRQIEPHWYLRMCNGH